MGTLSSPTKVKNIYQRLAFWTSATRQVSLDQGKDLADSPLFRPQMDISAFGITGNLASTDQAAFEAALTAAAGTTLVIDKPVSITANTTIAATNTLHFTRSGYLSVADGIYLNFTEGCEFNDCTHAIFVFAGVVKVRGVINHEYWRVEWFGAAADDQAANWGEVVNDMYDTNEAAGSSGSFYPRVFRFRRGRTYWTTDPLEIKLRTGSLMNDLVLESLPGSRWGGAILRSTAGVNVISGGTGSLVTRVAFRGLQFMGSGLYGADQTDYVVDASVLDLVEFSHCGFFYCKYGLQIRGGGAGAGLVTNGYFVNLAGATTNVMMLDIAMNMRFVACIMENSVATLNGNSTEPLSFESSHIEACNITVPEQTFAIRGPMGTTNGTTIKLKQDTCNCHVEVRGGGTYVYDLGHNNIVQGGYRFNECTGIASNVLQMGFPSTRDAGRMILQKDVPWIISTGISLDGATNSGMPAWVSGGSYTIGDLRSYSGIVYIALTTHSGVATLPSVDGTNWAVDSTLNGDYTFKLYDMASTPIPITNYYTAGTVINFGTIEVGSNSTRYIPVWYRQEWNCIIPSTNIFLQPSHDCNLRATRPLNLNPLMTGYDGGAKTFSDWQENGVADTLSTSGGYTRVEHASSGSSAFNYYQYVKLIPGKTYLAIMKITDNGGTDLPSFVVGSQASATTGEYNVAEFIETNTADVYIAMLLFRAQGNSPTIFSIGRDTSTHDCDFLVHFAAVVELGEGSKYISDDLPTVGVFYKGDTIIEEQPTTNTASAYICNVESVGTYGSVDNGCGMAIGAWVSLGTYVKGDCYTYDSKVWICRVNHTNVSTNPSADTTNWKLMETTDADGIGITPGNALFTTVS